LKSGWGQLLWKSKWEEDPFGVAVLVTPRADPDGREGLSGFVSQTGYFDWGQRPAARSPALWASCS
jgi:hypothetical protein